MDKYSVNRQYFGHDQFRPGQEVLIDAILSGRDCLGIMPTGGGKSLCYQVPGLLLPGLTLVISPLISLMADQAAALREAGIPVACWNSALEDQELDEVRRGLELNVYKLLYIAPERLDSPGFVGLMKRLGVSLVAVDEAHCISQWGQDFRPSYLKIAEFVQALPQRPVVAAFTATATQEVREDVCRHLELRDPEILVTGFDRPNLFFDVQRPKSKLPALQALIRQRRGKCGIVYCATRKAVESVCQALVQDGVTATRYHAGLDPEERQRNQEDFQYDRAAVMVATNAFGMGIDKSNVSFVIHYHMPKSLEAYYQEAGRAGRDGTPADCILLFSPQDVQTARYLIEHSEEREELEPERRAALRAGDYQRLKIMEGYCKTGSCFRGYLLSYFGQEHPARCGNCGSCTAQVTYEDITVPAQMILSCIQRVQDRLGYAVGASMIVKVLRGSRGRRLQELGLDRLSTFGLLSNLPQQQVQRMVDWLEQQGFLETEAAYRTLRLLPPARDVLFAGQTVQMPVRSAPPEEPTPTRTAAPAAAADAQTAGGLYQRLAALRTELARQQGVPPYIVFSNAALQDMARRRPTDEAAFLEVNGVGRVKAERYGERFLLEIRRYLAEEG